VGSPEMFIENICIRNPKEPLCPAYIVGNVGHVPTLSVHPQRDCLLLGAPHHAIGRDQFFEGDIFGRAEGDSSSSRHTALLGLMAHPETPRFPARQRLSGFHCTP